MTDKQVQQIVEGLQSVFISPNESDANWEDANMVDAVCKLARAVGRVADAIDRLGAAVRETRP